MDKWDGRFMQMAYTIAEWSSCFRAGRSIGCVIVKDKRIMTTGYNGAPAGIKTCREKGECMRDKLGIPSGTRMETCYAVHAEQNAIVQAAKLGVSIEGATLYCTHQPCSMCCKMIINSGIRRVIYKEGYPDEFTLELFAEAGVKLERLSWTANVFFARWNGKRSWVRRSAISALRSWNRTCGSRSTARASAGNITECCFP